MNQTSTKPSQENILIVDDNPVNVKVLSQILSGYQVQVLSDGCKLVDCIQFLPPDLILLGVNIKQISGYEICSRLKASAQTQDIPVIFLSNNAEDLDKVKVFEVGGVDYITAPFYSPEVLTRIENQFRSSRLEGMLARQHAEFEQEIQQRQQKLNDILNHALVAILSFRVYDNQTREYEYLSAGCEIILGYTPEELMADANLWASRVLPEDWENVIFPVFKDIFAERTVTFEYRFNHKNGSWRWISCTLSSRRDNQANCWVVTAVDTDITECKQTEIAQRQIKEQLSLLIDALPVYISYLDTNQQYQIVNKIHETRFGCNREEIQGKHIREVLGEDFYRVIQGNIEQALAGKPMFYQADCSNPDIGLCYGDVSLIPDFADDSQVRGCFCLIADVTERQQLLSALQDSQAKLNDILNSAIAAIVSFRAFPNRDWEYEYYSEGNEKIFGYTAQELMADKHLWASRVIPEDWEKVILPSFENIYAARSYTIEYRFYHKDGTICWIFESLISRRDEAADCWLVTGVSNDITERKRAEEALQQAVLVADAANSAKSEFLANMSHELRTPLNSILGFAQIMARDSCLNPEQQQYLSIINRAGEYLLALINDILEMSKIEAGKISLNPVSFDLISFLETLKDMLQLKANSKGLELTFDIAPNIPQYVQTDAGKLRQVLTNILGNAIKFTQQGGVTLRVRREEEGRRKKIEDRRKKEEDKGKKEEGRRKKIEDRRKKEEDKGKKEEDRGKKIEEKQGAVDSQPSTVSNLHYPCPITDYPLLITHSLIFEIEDTGCGIEKSELHLLFEPFSQTEAGRKSGQGTGLGLPISRKFVQMMGGDIQVSSTLGKGSLFTFDIQIDEVPSVEISTTQPTQGAIALAPNQGDYRILVVDDNSDNRKLLVTLFSSIGFAVQEAENGQEAVNLWESWQPHLITMDIQMPVMDGYQATHEIRVREGRKKKEDRRRKIEDRRNKIEERRKKIEDRRGDKPDKPDLGDNSKLFTVNCQPSTFHYSLTQDSSVIIALTASAFAESRQRVFAAGCDDFISKPFSQYALLEKVRQHLGVNYIYAEGNPNTSSVESKLWGDKLSASPTDCSPNAYPLLLSVTDAQPELSKMPPQWVTNLYQAACECADTPILELIKQVPPENQILVRTLTDLVYNFRFDTIIEWIDALGEEDMGTHRHKDTEMQRVGDAQNPHNYI
jgi:PAS domain S-box-containing protein